MLLATLGASLLGNILAEKIINIKGKGVNKKGKRINKKRKGINRAGEGIVRASYDHRSSKNNNKTDF